MDRKKLFAGMTALIVFIFVVNFLALKFYWYSSFWWSDIPMHFLGVAWVAMAVIWLFDIRTLNLKVIFKILAMVLVIGVLWEGYDLINDSIAKTPFNTRDTLSDICLDLLGGLTVALYLFKRINRLSAKEYI